MSRLTTYSRKVKAPPVSSPTALKVASATGTRVGRPVPAGTRKPRGPVMYHLRTGGTGWQGQACASSRPTAVPLAGKASPVEADPIADRPPGADRPPALTGPRR